MWAEKTSPLALIAHYIFCPRSLDDAALLVRAALEGRKRPDPPLARALVNLFSDIVLVYSGGLLSAGEVPGGSGAKGGSGALVSRSELQH